MKTHQGKTVRHDGSLSPQERIEKIHALTEGLLSICRKPELSLDELEQEMDKRGRWIRDLNQKVDRRHLQTLTDSENLSLQQKLERFQIVQEQMECLLKSMIDSQQQKYALASRQRKADSLYHASGTPTGSHLMDM